MNKHELGMNLLLGTVTLLVAAAVIIMFMESLLLGWVVLSTVLWLIFIIWLIGN